MSFKFKQFAIHQDKCAMKIGTDGVLLGAWAALNNTPDSILDIGTGTGVIALQLAQRCDALTIDALEIDANAHEQAVENFESSNWADRLFCYHCSLQEFVDEVDDTYDLIVANPPFYTDDFKTNNEARNKARFTTSLSFEDLLLSVSKLLSEQGVFSVIIPFKEEANFIALANKQQLFVNRVCHVQGTSSSKIKRSLLEFTFQNINPILENLIIEHERHKYTKEYQNLVKDFYLKM